MIRAAARPARLVQDAATWRSVASRLRSCRRLAIDVEADGFHRYPERVALIQLAVDDGSIWLLDPLALDDLAILGEVLADPGVPVVAHAGGFDVRALYRDFGFGVRALFDTAVAAQFCGARLTGLAHVAENVLGVQLDKPKRLQRTDWSRRPLSDEALAYAADDVRHLFAMADALLGRLETLGRRDWVAEECFRLESGRFRAPEPPESAFLAVPGARQLSDRGRAVLRELYLFREAEALRLGRPPYRILSEKILWEVADRPSAPLDEIPGFDPHWLARTRSRLEAAVARGLAGPGVPWQGAARHELWPRPARERLKRLKDWRLGEADELDLDAGIVWPADHLKQVALHPERATAPVGEPTVSFVREWQWATLGPSLETFRRDGLGDRVQASPPQP